MQNQPKTFWACLLLALSALTMLTACNTLEGAGKDIENAGEAIQESAD